jgi:hypothetical protein
MWLVKIAFTFLRRKRAPEGVHEVVNRVEALDALLGLVIETLVGRHHVREERVAPDGRDLHRAEHGAEGWHLTPAHVAVPLVLVARHVRALLEADHVRMAVLRGDERMLLDRTEALREGLVLRDRELLIPEEQHPVVEQRPPHVCDPRLVQPGQLDVLDLGADRRRQRPHLEVIVRAAGQGLVPRRQVGALSHPKRSEPHAAISPRRSRRFVRGP